MTTVKDDPICRLNDLSEQALEDLVAFIRVSSGTAAENEPLLIGTSILLAQTSRNQTAN